MVKISAGNLGAQMQIENQWMCFFFLFLSAVGKLIVCHIVSGPVHRPNDACELVANFENNALCMCDFV